MKLFHLSVCNPELLSDLKHWELVEEVSSVAGSLHATFDGAIRTCLAAMVETRKDADGNPNPDYEQLPEGFRPTWESNTWTIPDLGEETKFVKWTFLDEAIGDWWTIREMPVFGSDAFPE